MMKRTLLFCLLWSATAQAAPMLRHQVEQHGDFVMIGNTLGYDCDAASAVETPPDTVGACGAINGDSSIDIFWRADATAATADSTVSAATARSTAMLIVPAGATVTYARLYWGAIASGATLPGGAPAYTQATLDRDGGFSQAVTADATYTAKAAANNDKWYIASDDVTATVVANGPGAYRVSGVDSAPVVGANDNSLYAGWTLVVFYALQSEPPRNLALFDNFALVDPNTSQTQTISGFEVPDAGFDGKLGVFSVEGDSTLTGDQLTFNGATLSNAENPADNFFNSSRSYLGAGESNTGDLPLLSGAPGTLSGIDLDVVDISAQLKAGDKSATFTASTSSDTYWIGALVTSISTFAPDLSTSGKTFRNLSGGATLRPGDEVEYTIAVHNTGNDASVNTVVTDALPPGLDYAPTSLRITQGAGLGALTDASGDDTGEYDSTTRTLTIRIGAGATIAAGGALQPGESVTIVFDATIDVHAPSTIANQAVITASGAKGSPSVPYNTDGNGNDAGAPPTTFTTSPCAGPNDCTPPLFCATDLGACVECTATQQQTCTPAGKGAVCFTTTDTCGCETDADCSIGRPCNSLTKTCGGANGDQFPGIEGGGCHAQANDRAAAGAAFIIVAAWLSRRRKRN